MPTAISYQFSVTPYDVNDGVTVDYFVKHNFDTAQLVVPDTGIYSYEINKLKSMGVKEVIVDIEQSIWDGGRQKNTPISNFTTFFAQLKSIGVTKVASEGGRWGDLDVIGQYFPKGYMNYNCDQCGLWMDFYKHSQTYVNSWESYYTWEWPSIQQGVLESAPLGIKQGILAGMWGVSENPILQNTQREPAEPNYYSMGKWIDAHGGLDHFAVWGGLSPFMLGRYKALGLEAIVAKFQTLFPPRGLEQKPVTAAPKMLTILSLDQTNQTPKVGENVTLTATLRAGPRPGERKPLAGKIVRIWHYTNKKDYEDAALATDANGQVQTTQKWGYAGSRPYYATFDGDDQYTEAQSGTINVI